MKRIEVCPSGPLHGSIEIPGSKNSSVALLVAACLADEPITFSGIPDIYDIRVISQMFEDIGVKSYRKLNGEFVVDASNLHSGELDIEKSSSYRASYYFVGALLAKTGKVIIGYPGGDDFVDRPIDQHFKLFQALGANIKTMQSYYMVQANRLTGCEIFFDVITSGATINALLISALSKGTTVIRNAAVDPEVVDVANLLNAMGAKIRGAGTSEIRIEGVDSLHGCYHQVIPDRLIAGSFLIAAGVTGGSITVNKVIPEHLNSLLVKLKEIGLELDIRDQQITANGDVRLKATRVRTAMYPGFATDLQQPLSVLLLRAEGRSIVNERVYPKRFNHLSQLIRMGASIELRGTSAFIQGGLPLYGANVHASDVRAGVCLLLAGLIAEGTTVVTGVEHVERGYANIIDSFRSLGADMHYFNEPVSDYKQIVEGL